MRTYRKLNGTVVDIGGLAGEELALFERMYTLWKERGHDWLEPAVQVVDNSGNPLVRRAGRVTDEVWAHPLYQATKDLEYRIGLMCGGLAQDPKDEDPGLDPLEDEWVRVKAIADLKGVTVPAVHAAIQRGELVARPAREGGSMLLVSKASASRWTPMAVRQAAGRTRHGAAV